MGYGLERGHLHREVETLSLDKNLINSILSNRRKKGEICEMKIEEADSSSPGCSLEELEDSFKGYMNEGH